MISICIPIYNFNVTSLVTDLHREAEKENIPVEIVLIDDCSDLVFKAEHRKLHFSNLKYFELEKNVGRAKIRNLFLNYTQNNYLLFLDCDSLIVNPHFIQEYLTAIKQNVAVVCGGRVYTNVCPSKQQALSWTYGVTRESKSLKARKEKPYDSFMTNNFLIKKEVLVQNKLDERIEGYGHEDTLLGFTLKQNNVQILHINNAVLNGDVELNKVFLLKTEEGVKNLVEVLQIVNCSAEFIESVSLLQFYYKIKKWGLAVFVSLFFPMLKSTLKKQFLKGKINLRLFDLYKLGCLTQCLKTIKLN